MALGDRTNKVAGLQPNSTAIHQEQPKGSTSGKHHGFRSSQPAGWAVPAGMGADENGQQSIALNTPNAQPSGSSQQDHASICADVEADAQTLARSMSSSHVSVVHKAEVILGPDTLMQCLSLSDNKHAADSSAQESQLCHSSDRPQGSTAVQEEAVFSMTTANSSGTMKAIEAATISPGRRVFAAQVTVTRPTTPASPASVCR